MTTTPGAAFRQAITEESPLQVVGATPLFHVDELRAAGVDIALYCCGAYRMMNAAALDFYQGLRRDGTQKHLIPRMQTRADLYRFLDYHSYEDKLDALFAARD